MKINIQIKKDKEENRDKDENRNYDLFQGLQRKIQDHKEVTCGEGSVPDSIIGRRLTEVITNDKPSLS